MGEYAHYNAHIIDCQIGPVREPMKQTAKKATNLTIDQKVLSEAKEMKVNLSEAAEKGIIEATRKLKEAEWLAENKEALDEYNAYVEKNGLPLQKSRLF